MKSVDKPWGKQGWIAGKRSFRRRFPPISGVLLALWMGLAACSSDFAGEGGGEGLGEPEGPKDPSNRPIEDTYEPAPAPPLLPQATLDSIAEDVEAILNGGETHTLRVVNLTSGQDIVASNASSFLKPASNMKLFTSAAALEILGEDHRLSTQVLSDANIDASGQLNGDLWVVGNHDFSHSTYFYDADRTALDRLALALYNKGLRRVTGQVHVTGEFLYAGYSLGTLNAAAERDSISPRLNEAFVAAGIASPNIVTESSNTTPSGATLLLEHNPLPLSVAISPLNTVSHNEFADTLMRHLGSELQGVSSYTAGAQAIVDWLPSFGLATSGLSFNDGSGLSHSNRVNANALISLFTFMNQVEAGHSWQHSMAISGVRGTIRNRMSGDSTLGLVHAKTGTLRDTIALSGFLKNSFDGHRYAFAILLNKVSDKPASRSRCDQVVTRIAQNLYGVNDRLPAPEMNFARGIGWEGLLEASWGEVAGAKGYLVWFSEDGKSWKREEARYVTQASIVADGFSARRPTFVRVTAVDDAEFESTASVVFAAVAGEKSAPVLLVDANERWASQPENTLGENHRFLVALADPQIALHVDSVSNDALVSGLIDVNDYKAVVWAAGEESVDTDPLSEAEQSLLSDYLRAGGSLLLSGSELFYALNQRAASYDIAFLNDVLHTSFSLDDSGTYEVVGTASTPFADIGISSFYSPDHLDVQYPDVLAPGSQSESLMDYVGGQGGSAVVGSQEGLRFVVTGFPIEAMMAASDRRAILQASYDYLGLTGN